MKHRYDKLLVYFIGYFYTLVMLYLASTILYGGVPFLTLLLIATGVYPIINLLLAFRISRLVSCLLLGAGALATGVLYLTGNGRFITAQMVNIVEIYEKAYYQETIRTAELRTTAFVLVILASILLSVLVHFLFNRFFRLFLLTGATIALQLAAWFFNGKANVTVLAVICILTVISYFRHIYESKVKSGLLNDHKVSGSLMLFSIPIAIIPVLIIMGIPKSDLPIQWPWLDNKVFQVMQYVEQKFGHTDMEFFSLSATGFNNSTNRLGGPVRPSHTIMMDVKGDRRTYLRGAAYSRYENNMWIQNTEDVSHVLEMENSLLENRMGWMYIPVNDLFPEVEGDDAELLDNLASGRANPFLFPSQSLEVQYRNISTKTVFSPLLTILPITNSDGNIRVMQNVHGITNQQDKLTTGSRYSLRYVQPMYGAPMLKKALTFSYDTLYNDAVNELYRQRNALINSITTPGNPVLERLNVEIDMLEKLLDRSREIEKHYTDLSENIPERVGNLATSITYDCKNDYEKVMTIENYLRSRYEYTLNASRVPDGYDFLDWFLFEDKRGYCTYYATAMTIMLRYNGIPARYVEGFVMPERHNDRLYTITSRHAHAWVEVYFQGFGWLTFEPTPVYADVMQYLPSPENVDSSAMSAEELEELMKQYAERYGRTDFLPEDSPGQSSNMNITPYLRYIPMIAAGLLIGMIVINLLAILIDHLILLGVNHKKKVTWLFQTMLLWLEHSGYVIKPGETVLEFSRRVDKNFSFDIYTFTDVSEVFYRVRYGDREVTGDDLLIIQSTMRQLKKSLLKDFGMRRFLPLRRIIFRI